MVDVSLQLRLGCRQEGTMSLGNDGGKGGWDGGA
jgi:hypothetical protein